MTAHYYNINNQSDNNLFYLPQGGFYKMSETLILNGKDLTLEDLYSVVYDRRPVQIDPEVIPLLSLIHI